MLAHVVDDLELYVLGAMPAAEAARIAEHLSACGACRAQAAALADVVNQLSAMVPAREPSAALRARILSAARAEIAARPAAQRAPFWNLRARPRAIAFGGMAAAVLLLAGLNVGELGMLNAAQTEKAALQRITEKMSGSGRTWYMAGVGDWKGSGGTLVARTDQAFVLFHDLKPLEPEARYALWLVSPDGKWVRGATFKPDGSKMQTVDLATAVAGYDRCAVTLDTGANTSPKDAPVVMQSRIAPPTP